MAILINADNSMVEISNDDKMFTLDIIRNYVGGYIELVKLDNNPDYLLCVNEDAKLRQLPPNRIASVMKYDSAASPRFNFIAGDVVYIKIEDLELD